MKQLSYTTVRKYSPDKLARHLSRYLESNGITEWTIDLSTGHVVDNRYVSSLDLHEFNFWDEDKGRMVGLLREVYHVVRMREKHLT